MRKFFATNDVSLLNKCGDLSYKVDMASNMLKTFNIANDEDCKEMSRVVVSSYMLDHSYGFYMVDPNEFMYRSCLDMAILNKMLIIELKS